MAYIHLAEWIVCLALLAVCLVEIVLLLQVTGDSLALVVVVSAVQALAVFIHSDGHDVHVVSVNILMLVNHIWLVAISHALQVFPCDILHLHIRQHIIRMRIQGDMHDWFFCSDVRRKVSLEITQGVDDARLSRTIIEDLVRCQELSLFLVNLSPLYASAPYNELPKLIFATIFPQTYGLVQQSHG